jgi:hypothetical protein
MYEVSFSGRVLDSLRQLAARNPAHTGSIAAALRAIEYRLRLYPQFGQPLYDLSAGPAQLWIGVVPPLVFHYVLEENPRRVTVLRPPRPLPRTGIV